MYRGESGIERNRERHTHKDRQIDRDIKSRRVREEE